MMPSSYLWYSPQDVPLSTFETDVSCDPTYPYSYTSDLPFVSSFLVHPMYSNPSQIPDIVSPIISSSSFPYGPTGSSTRQYKSDSIESGSTSLAGDMEPHSPAGRRGQKSEAQTTRGGRQRKVFAVDEEPMRGMSHDSMDSNVESGTVERTPAQKMVCFSHPLTISSKLYFCISNGYGKGKRKEKIEN